MATSKKPAKKSSAKAAAKKSAKKATAAAKKATTKKASAKKSPAATKAVKKATAKKSTSTSKSASSGSTAKKSGGKVAKSAGGGRVQSSSGAAKKTTAPSAGKDKAASAAKTKASGKSQAKKATANPNVAQSKTAPQPKKSETRTIPAEYGYLHDKKWLAGQREALLRERESYTSSAERLAAEAAALMADREPGDVQFDEESGEGDTIAVERDRDLALSAAARQAVSEIDAALARLDDKTYGMCLAGDDIIPQERLEAIPEASVCVTHKTSMF